jgi:hypothetical protein
MNNYDIEGDLNKVSSTLIANVNECVNGGLKEIGKVLEGKQAKFNRAVFNSFPESQQVQILKNLTKTEGLTQKQAGNLCGLDQPTVSRRLGKS